MENDKKESGVYYVSTPGGMIRTAIVSDGKVYTGEKDDKTVYKVLERVPNEIMVQAYLSTFSKERE